MSAALRGRLLGGKNKTVELNGETYTFAPLPIKFRTELLGKIPDPRHPSLDAIFTIGSEIVFECLLNEEGQRAFKGEADRKAFFEGGTSDELTALCQAAFRDLLFPQAEQRKEETEQLGKGSSKTPIATSSTPYVPSSESPVP